MSVENVDNSIDVKQGQLDTHLSPFDANNLLKSKNLVFQKIDNFQEKYKNITSDEGRSKFNDAKKQIDQCLSKALNDFLLKNQFKRMENAERSLNFYFQSLSKTINDYQGSLEQILEVEQNEQAFSNSLLEFKQKYSIYLSSVSKGGQPEGSDILNNASNLIAENAKLSRLIENSRNLPDSFQKRMMESAKNSMEKLKEVLVAVKMGEVIKKYYKYLEVNLSYNPRIELNAKVKKDLVLIEDKEYEELQSSKNDDKSKKQLEKAVPVSVASRMAVELGGKNTDLLKKAFLKEVEDEIIEETDTGFQQFFAGKKLILQGQEAVGVALLRQFLDKDVQDKIPANHPKKEEYKNEANDLINKIESVKRNNKLFFEGQELLKNGDIYGAKVKLLQYLNDFNVSLSEKGLNRDEVEKKFLFLNSAKDLLKEIAITQVNQLIDRSKGKEPKEKIRIMKGDGYGVNSYEEYDNPEYKKYENFIKVIKSVEAKIRNGEVVDFNAAVSTLPENEKQFILGGKETWNQYEADESEDSAAKNDQFNQKNGVARKSNWLRLARKYRAEKNYAMAEEYFNKYFAERLNKLMKEDEEVSLKKIKDRYAIKIIFMAKDKVKEVKRAWDKELEEAKKSVEEEARRQGGDVEAAKKEAEETFKERRPWNKAEVESRFVDAAAKEMLPREVQRRQQIKLNIDPKLMQGEELVAWNEFANMKGIHDKGTEWRTMSFSDQEIDNLVKELPIQVAIIGVSAALSGGVGGAVSGAIMRQGAIRAGGAVLADELLAMGAASGGRRLAAWGAGLLVENTLFTASTTVANAIRSGQFETSHLGEEWAKGLLTLGGLNLVGRMTKGLGIGERAAVNSQVLNRIGTGVGRAAGIGIEVAGMANIDILASAIKDGNFERPNLVHTLSMVLGLKIAHVLPHVPKAIKSAKEAVAENNKFKDLAKELNVDVKKIEVQKISLGEHGEVIYEGRPTNLKSQDLPSQVLNEVVKASEAQKLERLKKQFGDDFENNIKDGNQFSVDKDGVLLRNGQKTDVKINDLPSELRKLFIDRLMAESIADDTFGIAFGTEGGIRKEGRIVYDVGFFNKGQVEIYDVNTGARKQVKILPNEYQIVMQENGPVVAKYELDYRGVRKSDKPLQLITIEQYRKIVQGTEFGDAFEVAMYRVKQHEVHHRLLNYARKLMADGVPFEDALVGHFESNLELAKELGIEKGKDGKFKYEDIEERLAELSDRSDFSVSERQRAIAEGILKNFFGKTGIDYSMDKAVQLDSRLIQAAARKGVNYGERKTEAAKGGVRTEKLLEGLVGGERLDRNNTEKPIEQVKRRSEVISIGDLHGNAEILLLNLKHLCVINADANLRNIEGIKWTGGKRKMVFLGDILADRGVQSIEALKIIDMLSIKAKEQGGEVSLIAGNHEDFAFSFLASTKLGEGDLLPTILYSDQAIGILELFQKFSNDQRFKNVNSPMDLVNKASSLNISFEEIQQNLLRDMRSHPEGRKVLEQMAKMKVAEYIDDILYTHTDLTPEMIERLDKQGKTIGEVVDEINEIYQKGVRVSLGLENGTVPVEFDSIREIFLSTASGRRADFKIRNKKDLHLMPSGESSALAERLVKKGVNRHIHGHTEVDAENSLMKFGRLESYSVDYGAGKRGKNMEERSVAVIGVDGKFSNGLDAKIDRSAEVETTVIKPFETVLNKVLSRYEASNDIARKIIASFNEAVGEFWKAMKDKVNEAYLKSGEMLKIFENLLRSKLNKNTVDADISNKIFEGVRPLNEAKPGQTRLYSMSEAVNNNGGFVEGQKFDVKSSSNPNLVYKNAVVTEVANGIVTVQFIHDGKVLSKKGPVQDMRNLIVGEVKQPERVVANKVEDVNVLEGVNGGFALGQVFDVRSSDGKRIYRNAKVIEIKDGYVTVQFSLDGQEKLKREKIANMRNAILAPSQQLNNPSIQTNTTLSSNEIVINQEKQARESKLSGVNGLIDQLVGGVAYAYRDHVRHFAEEIIDSHTGGITKEEFVKKLSQKFEAETRNWASVGDSLSRTRDYLIQRGKEMIDREKLEENIRKEDDLYARRVVGEKYDYWNGQINVGDVIPMIQKDGSVGWAYIEGFDSSGKVTILDKSGRNVLDINELRSRAQQAEVFRVNYEISRRLEAAEKLKYSPEIPDKVWQGFDFMENGVVYRARFDQYDNVNDKVLIAIRMQDGSMVNRTITFSQYVQGITEARNVKRTEYELEKRRILYQSKDVGGDIPGKNRAVQESDVKKGKLLMTLGSDGNSYLTRIIDSYVYEGKNILVVEINYGSGNMRRLVMPEADVIRWGNEAYSKENYLKAKAESQKKSYIDELKRSNGFPEKLGDIFEIYDAGLGQIRKVRIVIVNKDGKVTMVGFPPGNFNLTVRNIEVAQNMAIEALKKRKQGL